jgi:hypothetical protein
VRMFAVLTDLLTSSLKPPGAEAAAESVVRRSGLRRVSREA